MQEDLYPLDTVTQTSSQRLMVAVKLTEINISQLPSDDSEGRMDGICWPLYLQKPTFTCPTTAVRFTRHGWMDELMGRSNNSLSDIQEPIQMQIITRINPVNIMHSPEFTLIMSKLAPSEAFYSSSVCSRWVFTQGERG